MKNKSMVSNSLEKYANTYDNIILVRKNDLINGAGYSPEGKQNLTPYPIPYTNRGKELVHLENILNFTSTSLKNNSKLIQQETTESGTKRGVSRFTSHKVPV